MIEKIQKNQIIDLIKTAIKEDLDGYGDITSKYLIPPDSLSNAFIICKEKNGAVLCGIDIVGYILEEFNQSIVFNKKKEDGMYLKNKEIICYISGLSRDLLAAERTCLNFLQHLSGIATETAKLSAIASKYKVKIVDTRKTKPGLRKIEKYAVKCGGGYNHRFGLFDGVLIKDNHIIVAGGIKKAIETIKPLIPHQLKIEVEVKNFDELKHAIEAKADIIMLDNMDIGSIAEAVKIIRQNLKNCIIEASGNISINTVEDICKTGVDIISCGFITHSAKAIDFSMEFEQENFIRSLDIFIPFYIRIISVFLISISFLFSF